MSSHIFGFGVLALILSPVIGVHPIVRHYMLPATVKLCGDPVLYCEIQTPDAKVWWTLNGTRVTDNPNITVLQDTSNTTTVWKLQISCAQFSHSGNYTCHVKTTESSTHYTKSISLHVSETLTIQSTQWVKGELGERTILNCTIIGYPLPQAIEWNKNGSTLESRGNINISQRVIGTSQISSYLEIHNLTEAFLGPYACLASNGVDFVSTDITIVNKGLSRPTDVYVRPQNPTSIILKWKSLPSEGGIKIDYHRISMSYRKKGLDSIKQEQNFDVMWWNSQFLPYYHQHTMHDLEGDAIYSIQISACNNLIGCGEHSDPIQVELHGYSSAPMNVSVTCHYDNISLGSYVDVTWEPPKESSGHVMEYRVQLLGFAQYVNSWGMVKFENDTPIIGTSSETKLKQPVAANTNYTVQVCAVTSVGCGNLSDVSPETSCSTPPSVPQELPTFVLKKAEATDDCLELKLNMERVTERHGPIQCYRVILYKMKHGKQTIPSPRDINISTYEDVHRDGEYGAYVAEAFDGEKFQTEVTLGDDSQSRCDELSTFIRHRRNIWTDEDDDESVHDGKLSPDTSYSGFVEVKVLGKDEMILTKRSSLFMPIRTGYLKYNLQATALGVICGLLIVIIILTVALCALRNGCWRQDKFVSMCFFCSKRNHYADYDGNGGLGHMICSVFRQPRRAGQMMTPVLPPPDTKPLKPENLTSAFLERHKDSDLLFQREFEALPELFRDRTTRGSDMLENFFKNRYPDIKAYDQTRVKLSAIDGVAGSDYINANFVMGYKDRKKFICAQGPLDKTVNDFWRMIWEQKVEIVVMVTGLEENGKMKCAKYWPEQDEKKYGEITVTTGECNMCADYCVRRFTISHKKDEGNPETREILQFHYLAWKDFLAPEHPGGILKFINRINEAHKPDRGPILVHCSAGVGRTGTLVVIDSLLQQMKEEGHVEVFNFVVSLRRQRNFLVQSLKQYIFIYRALMEFAQFGDTEFEAKDLKEKWSQLQKSSDKSGRTLLQLEFEKLDEVIEDPKGAEVAITEVNIFKNRVESIIPYDRNRVIVTPVPSREHSTYINASFIQGYHRTATYIVTQDPMECSVSEFWRMVYEQCIYTIVMLTSNLALEYWPDDEADYDHISVKFIHSASLDHFTKLEFLVTNTKNSKSNTVTQFQYKGWSDGEVPKNTTGFIELVKAVQEAEEEAEGPVAVHCRTGSDRSPLFVACCILLKQLETERRADVFQTCRNMRSQRVGMLTKLSQYKFCYKVALDFVQFFSTVE